MGIDIYRFEQKNLAGRRRVMAALPSRVFTGTSKTRGRNGVAFL